MPEFWSDFAEKLGVLAGKWTGYAALGSFLLYLVGYLTLRFQLSTYGVATNLDVFDEKYLFAGCRFVIYMVSAVPNILIIVLLLAAISYFPYKFVPPSLKDRVGKAVNTWCSAPLHLPVLGVVFAVVFIQFVLRRCFAYGNVLLSKQLPDEWLSSILLGSDGKLSLYFTALVAGVLLTGAVLLYELRCVTIRTSGCSMWTAVLVFLFAVEFLLLPVNYGVLVSTQQLPRVAELSGAEKALDGQRIWLLWDSKDAITYFVRDAQNQNTIVTLPRKDSKVRISAYDDIFCVLFGSGADARPCSR